jgi:hypothetical protein
MKDRLEMDAALGRIIGRMQGLREINKALSNEIEILSRSIEELAKMLLEVR